MYGVGAVLGILLATILGQLYGRRGMLTKKTFYHVLPLKMFCYVKMFSLLASPSTSVFDVPGRAGHDRVGDHRHRHQHHGTTMAITAIVTLTSVCVCVLAF